MTNATIESGKLRVVFAWRGDRYGHAIQRRMDGDWRTVLESVEGCPDDDWPQSPPLQSLHIERRPLGAVALLVGKAAASHWSASVDPLPALAGFQFDIACRVQQSPPWLGSAYRSADRPSQPLIQIAAQSPDASCEFVVDHEISVWRIRPAAIAQKYPATIRWRYTVVLDNDATRVL
jgi:hypothetical protein